MNKKLTQKLKAKATKVFDLRAENPHFRAHSLGRSAYQLIGGSYGITINPFNQFEKVPDGTGSMKTVLNRDHAEFRLGFNFERKVAPKHAFKQRVPVVNLRGYLVKVRRVAA